MQVSLPTNHRSFFIKLNFVIPPSELEIRLTCQSTKCPTSTVSRGKPQNGATLVIRLNPPSDFGDLHTDEEKEKEERKTELRIDVDEHAETGAEYSDLESPSCTYPQPSCRHTTLSNIINVLHRQLNPLLQARLHLLVTTKMLH